MIHIKEGNYHTLAEVAQKFNTNKMKLLSLNGYLYRSYWSKQKGYTCKESLHLKDTQTNRRIAQKIISQKKT